MSVGPSTVAVDARAATADHTDDDGGWRRLDRRVIWVDGVKIVASLLPSFLTMVIFDLDLTALALWSIVATAVFGAGSALIDLLRWMHSWYRITDERVELRTGRLVLKVRSVPRDRIRSVDTTAKLRHRLAGLRIVHIGSGEQRASFHLDAVSRATAEQLYGDLMRGRPAGRAAAGDSGTGAHDGGTVIATVRWWWIFYNIINVWAFLVAAFLLWSAYWALQLVNVDLGRLLKGTVDWAALGPGWSAAVMTGGAFALGVIGLGLGFVKDNWHFQLVRARTDTGTALLTRQGLSHIREVYRDDRRLRGIFISEPLFWRWMGLTETEVISTGLAGWSPGSEPASIILPRTPLREARRVARLVLDDGHHPLEAPLRAHPAAALYRRCVWAVLVPLCAAGLLAWLGATGAVAGWSWLVAVALVPVAGGLAVLAHRALGHALVGPYIVMRSGVSRRSTSALQGRAVVGWTISRSPLQRLLGLATVGVATAAGQRFYRAPDIQIAAAVAFVNESTPGWLDAFLERPVRPTDESTMDSDSPEPDPDDPLQNHRSVRNHP
jgi:putative membrane protein